MRVVLAGASGLIGTALAASLRDGGHELVTLVRRAPSGPSELRWDPAAGKVDAAALEGADAVVCLSGVGVGDHRWTESYKQDILRSRVDSIGALARAMAGLDRPGLFLAASAVGYYGDRGDEELTETSAAGTGFLADVCTQWEAAADPARAAGVTVSHLRTGLVLTARGGLLKQLKPIVQSGVAGRLGSGRQFMPWITLHDEIRAIEFLLHSPVAGPVNLVGPAPARNVDLTKALGRALHRPTVFPTPGFALKLVLGEFGGEALGGQRVLPAALRAAGFGFEHSDLDTALAWALADTGAG